MAVPVGVKEAIIFITMKTRARSQALPATIIIIMKTRALLANAGNSSLKMAAPIGVVKAMASLNQEATMHAQWQLADA